MMDLDSLTLSRLKNNYMQGRGARYLVKMFINSEWVYITTADTVIEYSGDSYYPGFISEESIDDIEVTSEPKTNDIGIKLDANDPSFVPLMLNSGWMNGPVTIFKQVFDDMGVIFTKNVFEGLLDTRDIEPEKRLIMAKVSSVWADFDKQAGIRTNTKSQQRYYAGDTAFDHVAKARRKLYWGRNAPSSGPHGQNVDSPGNRFPDPRILPQ